MKTIRIILSLAALLTVLPLVNAQYMDPMMGIETLQMQANMQVEQGIAQMQQIEGQRQQQFANYYWQATGNSAIPIQQAAVYGEQLWCQNYPVECQQHYNSMSQISAAGHQQNMNDIQTWGDVSRQTGQTNSDILDMMHRGYLDRSATNDQGQGNYVQGAVYNEANYYGPNGSSLSLPVYPDPNQSYWTPEGYPLGFDYQTNTWYQGDGYGSWTPLWQ
jgi:hypothetical protein